MIFGKPWTPAEEGILLGYPGSNPAGIQKKLLDAGYQRTIEAIKRKQQRLSGSIHQDEYTSNPAPFKKKKAVKWVSGEALPLTKDVTKFVLLNDVHVPHNIELDSVFTFFDDFKPDYAILNGDIVNNDPFSHWDKSSPLRFKNMPQPKAYYE